MKQLLIIHLAQRYLPNKGGVEHHVQKVSERLVKDGHQVSVLCLDEKNESSEMIDSVSIVRVSLPVASEGSLLEKVIYKLRVWLEVGKRLPLLWQADVIQIHDVFWWLLPYSPVLFFKKIYMTFHRYESEFGVSLGQRLQHKVANLLTTSSLTVGRFHEKWYGVKGDEITFGAVEEEKKSNKKKNSVIKFVFIGRLASDTAIWQYLHAFKEVVQKQRRKKSELHVFGIGDAEFEKGLQMFVTENALPVVFHGFVTDARKRLAEFDVAFATQYLAILECLVAKVPVVAYAPTLFKKDVLEMANFSDWITVTTDEQALADAMIEMSKKGDTEMVEEAYHWAKKQTWEKLVAQYYLMWGIR